MPVIDLRKSQYALGSRICIFGPPNTFKTTAMLTWPKPLAIMLYPGELGWDTVPRDRDDIIPITFQFEDPAKVSPAQVVREVEQTTWRLLAGDYGAIASFGGDGLHKLYDWYYQSALLEMIPNFRDDDKGTADEKARGPAYGRAHDNFGLYLTRLLSSRVPWIVCSLWEGRVKDNPDDTRKGAPRHVYPDLPGQMASRIVGQFASGVLYSEVTLPDPMGRIKGTWQTRKLGDVWGVGLKGPEELIKKAPAKIPQTFEALQKIFKGEAS